MSKLLAVSLLLLAAGCRAPMPPPPEVAITPEEILGTFLVRQKLSGVFGGHADRRFDSGRCPDELAAKA